MRNWEIGRNSVSLPQFDWDPEQRRMLYGGWGIKFGTVAQPPDTVEPGSSIRLYSIEELRHIVGSRGLRLVSTRSNYASLPASAQCLQMEIYSQKAA